MVKRASHGTTPVLFHKVCEWQPDDIVVERGVWVAFDARRVAVYEFDGRDTHAAVLEPGEVLAPTWRNAIDEVPAAWLLPHLERFARGADIRRAVLDEYSARNGGGSPQTTEWAIVLERNTSARERRAVVDVSDELAAPTGLLSRLRAVFAPTPVPPGPWTAAMPYPDLRSRSARRAFARCEEYLLREILDADQNASRVPGDIAFALPWIVSPMRASGALAEDTKGGSGGRAAMDVVVDWLTGHGALRPLPADQSQQLVEDGHLRRIVNGATRADLPNDSVAAEVERFHQDADSAVREVVPSAMLTVYPWLAEHRRAWGNAARR